MATFHPVDNTTTLVAHAHARSSSGDEANPLTPRPDTAPTSNLPIQPVIHGDDATTPTRANFKALGQKPLPLPPSSSSHFPATVTSPAATDEASPAALSRGDSTYSAKSGTSEDVDMDSDGADEGSDEESSLNADGTRSSKKKGKSQRFYCTDYPPCNLSFTRSEHLARHIRKHTGERPFQCHCSRRFSRLDNLRQHAQTVHQNEEIPPESLAATGTRFQRQVRSDRVRPSGSRCRANTAGSTGPLRGHHTHTRNSLSTSSIGSVGSAYSRDAADMRRRPPRLVMMAGGEGNPFSREVREGSPSFQYRPASPAGSNSNNNNNNNNNNTPASATLPAGLNSPRWTSAMPSPISSHSHSHSHSHSRTASIYNGHRTPGRRLSVPSAGNPFQSPHGSNNTTYGPPALGRMHANMGAYSPSSSMISSPTTTTTSGWARRESLGSNADVEYRRRTWHPETMDNFPPNYTSRLQQVTTNNNNNNNDNNNNNNNNNNDNNNNYNYNNNNYYSSGPPPRPPIVPSNAPPLQALRLPGIESFDPLPPRPSTPVRRHPSPMMIDPTPTRAAPMLPEYRHERPNSQHWEQGMNRNMNQLRLQGTPPSDAANSWGSDVDRAVQAQGDRARATPVVRFDEYIPRPQTSGGPYHHQHHVAAPPAPLTPEKAKRFAWYHGPTKAMQVQQVQPIIQRTSPAESSGSESAIPVTPNSATHGEYNPGIVHASGRVETWNATSQRGDPRGVPTAYYPPPQHSHEASYTYAPGAPQVQMAHQQQIPKSTDSNMLRLEALVAVATSEENVATAY